MNTLRVHLWREWREHRRALYLLAGCLALVAGVLTRVAPGHYMPLEWIVPVIVATATLSIGSDLFASEKQRGTDAFLARTPGALSGAFNAKLVFFLLLFLGSAIYGMLLGIAMSAITTGHLPGGEFVYATDWNLVFLLTGLLWVFAVSTWVKTSALTIPATLLFLCIVAFPGWLMAGGLAWFRASSGVMIAFLVLAAVGALFSARLGFVRGGERGWSPRKATIMSVLSAALAFAPSWAWAGSRYHAMKGMGQGISWVHIGEGGRFAFVTLQRAHFLQTRRSSGGPMTAVVVDLNTGETTLAGELDGSAWSPTSLPRGHRAWFYQHGLPVITLHDDLPLWGDVSGGKLFYDGATGKPLDSGVRERASLAWEELDWPAEFDNLRESSFFGHAGLGYRASGRHADGSYRQLLWDPATDIVVDLRQLPGHKEGDRYEDVRIGPSGWLARLHDGPRVWVDPLTGVAEPAEFIEPDDVIGPSFDDGSILILRDGELLKLWARSGASTVIELSGGEQQPLLSRLGYSTTGPLSSTEPCAFTATVQFGATWETAGINVLILDPATMQAQVVSTGATGPDLFRMAGKGPGFVIGIQDNRQLVRIDTQTGHVRVLLDQTLFTLDQAK